MRLSSAFVFLVGASGALAFVPLGGMRTASSRRATPRMVVPLELEGELDPSKVWEVKMTLNGETKVLKVSEGDSILEAAEKEFDAPFSCRNGICTTCAAKITANKANVKEAIHGLSAAQQAAGYVLTCQSHPCGPGIEVELGQYDTVYHEQYGRAADDINESRAKKFSLFG